MLQTIKDIVTIIAAGVASYVAIAGLNAWKEQLKGKVDYELARRYLKAVYKTRDALKYVRNPFISIDEIAAAAKETGVAVEADPSSAKSNRAVYSLRWDKVIEARSDLSLELLEAEVSWGIKATQVEKDLDSCLGKLRASLKLFLMGHNLDGQRDIIYDGGEGDKFNLDLTAAIQKIEDYLKPHLK